MDFITNLSTLIHNTPEDTRILIESFERKSSRDEFMKPYFDKIPLVKVLLKDQWILGADGKAEPLNFVELVGRGEFGNVYQGSEKKFVYKVIHKNKYTWKGRAYLKHAFKEVIIQSFLQCEPVNGNHICKLEALYRTDDSIILKIEKLNKSLLDHIVQVSEKTGARTNYSVSVKKSIIDVLELVDYFHKNYDFHHYDLQLGNIMVADDNTLKLIDFGWDSYVKIGENKIGYLNPYDYADDAYRLIWSITRSTLFGKLSWELMQVLNPLERVGRDLTLTQAITEVKKVHTGGRRTKSKATRKRRSKSATKILYKNLISYD
jgi:serine/threonine protein kinase